MPATQTHIHEASRVYTWLQATLAGDGTLAALVTGGWWRSVKQGGTFTQMWGVYQRSGGVDTPATGSYRVAPYDLYIVKVVSPIGSDADDAALTAAADRLDTLLQGANGTTSDGTIPTCTRDSQIDYDEIFENVLYRHAGGMWRILAQPLHGA